MVNRLTVSALAGSCYLSPSSQPLAASLSTSRLLQHSRAVGNITTAPITGAHVRVFGGCN